MPIDDLCRLLTFRHVVKKHGCVMSILILRYVAKPASTVVACKFLTKDVLHRSIFSIVSLQNFR